MANQQLVDYIKSQLAAGVTKPDLQKAVSTAGWSEQDSSEAFAVAEGKAPAAPVAPAQPAQPKPVTPVAPMQPAQPMQPIQPAQPVQQPMQQPVKPVQPMMPTQQPVINPSGPTSTIQPNLGGPMRASTMQMNVQAGGPRRHTVLWASLATVVLLVAAGAAAYMTLSPVRDVVNFYLSGGQPPTGETTAPVNVQQPADTSANTIPTTTGTTTASTTSTQPTGAVASTSASTTLKH